MAEFPTILLNPSRRCLQWTEPGFPLLSPPCLLLFPRFFSISGRRRGRADSPARHPLTTAPHRPLLTAPPPCTPPVGAAAPPSQPAVPPLLPTSSHPSSSSPPQHQCAAALAPQPLAASTPPRPGVATHQLRPPPFFSASGAPPSPDPPAAALHLFHSRPPFLLLCSHRSSQIFPVRSPSPPPPFFALPAAPPSHGRPLYSTSSLGPPSPHPLPLLRAHAPPPVRHHLLLFLCPLAFPPLFFCSGAGEGCIDFSTAAAFTAILCSPSASDRSDLRQPRRPQPQLPLHRHRRRRLLPPQLHLLHGLLFYVPDAANLLLVLQLLWLH